MKILYFTFISPSELFGGGIGVLQSLYSLCSFAQVDYVGPSYSVEEFTKYGINLSHTYIIQPKDGTIRRLANLVLHHITTSFYSSWKDTVRKLDTGSYDCIYIDYSRQHFVVEWAKRHNIPTIIRAHNVESDYFAAMYVNHKTPTNFLHKFVGKIAETKCINAADKVIVLTQKDRERFLSLYGFNKEHYPIVPVCVKHFNPTRSERLPEHFILITGTLWFGPNASGTEWFLDKVWRKIEKYISEKYVLVIAGADPNERIIELSKKLKNVYLYKNPEKIDVFYARAYIYVAPIFYGAGMKVKIAEALSCGLPVITTFHAATGYEAVNDSLYVGDTEQEFIDYLKMLACMTSSQMMELRKNIQYMFEKNFSLNVSAKAIQSIVYDIVQR